MKGKRGVFAVVLVVLLLWGGAVQGISSAPTWQSSQLVASNARRLDYSWPQQRTLAYDHYGNPGIAYSIGSQLKFAWHSAAGWTASSAEWGPMPSLAYDAYERPHIAYEADCGDVLAYCHWTGSYWTADYTGYAVTLGYGDVSLALDLYGRPGVAFKSGGVIKYIYDTDGDGKISDEVAQTVDSEGSPYYCSLAFDHLNNPMIAYYVHGDEGNEYNRLRFATKQFGAWGKQTLLSPGTVINDCDITGWVSLAVDPITGQPGIAFANTYNSGGTQTSMWYLDYDGSNWNTTTLATGTMCSLAFDPADGNPAVAYHAPGGGLMLTYYDGSSWQVQTVVSGSDNVGHHPSLAFNPYGSDPVGIAYTVRTGFSTGDLYYIQDPPIAPSAVFTPEPATVTLLIAGAAALGVFRHRHGRKVR